jgi:alginate O-acetyltransferase complex protein AlgI
MLFNSCEFIFLFMPVAMAGFAVLHPRNHRAALVWLTILSLFFYAYWNWHAIWILVASVAFNFACGLAIRRSAGSVSRRRLILGVAGNLLALGIFKYAGFAAEIVNDIAGTHFVRPEITCRRLVFHFLRSRRSPTLWTSTSG